MQKTLQKECTDEYNLNITSLYSLDAFIYIDSATPFQYSERIKIQKPQIGSTYQRFKCWYSHHKSFLRLSAIDIPSSRQKKQLALFLGSGPNFHRVFYEKQQVPNKEKRSLRVGQDMKEFALIMATCITYLKNTIERLKQSHKYAFEDKRLSNRSFTRCLAMLHRACGYAT